MKAVTVLAVSGGLFAASAVALAQDSSGYPNMRGPWKGTSESIVLGTGMYQREGGKPDEPRLVNKEFTFTIKGQEGRRFWGDLSSKDETGPVLGVIANDKQTLHIVDSAGGHITGKLTEPGQFEMCYMRPVKE